MKYLAAIALAIAAALAAAPEPVRFVIIGDRTGETVPGIYERIVKEVTGEKPAFVLGVGDMIQGLNDATAEAEWQAVPKFQAIPIYTAPGNHDIWSEASEKLFMKYTGHLPHYGFDVGDIHVTVLDNSRTEQLAPAELTFLEEDLKAHATQPLKIVISHRPSWILNVTFGSPDFELHKIAKKYAVKYVIAGHIHKLAHAEVDGITYISMPSAGGHLRDTGKYEDGWFFGYAILDSTFRFKQLDGPTTTLKDWSIAGLK